MQPASLASRELCFSSARRSRSSLYPLRSLVSDFLLLSFAPVFDSDIISPAGYLFYYYTILYTRCARDLRKMEVGSISSRLLSHQYSDIDPSSAYSSRPSLSRPSSPVSTRPSQESPSFERSLPRTGSWKSSSTRSISLPQRTGEALNPCSNSLCTC